MQSVVYIHWSQAKPSFQAKREKLPKLASIQLKEQPCAKPWSSRIQWEIGSGLTSSWRRTHSWHFGLWRSFILSSRPGGRTQSKAGFEKEGKYFLNVVRSIETERARGKILLTNQTLYTPCQNKQARVPHRHYYCRNTLQHVFFHRKKAQARTYEGIYKSQSYLLAVVKTTSICPLFLLFYYSLLFSPQLNLMKSHSYDFKKSNCLCI